MRIQFWGTRGSIAKPGPGTVRFGGNTSCVEVRSDAGTLIVIDCGTGAHGLGQKLMSESGGGPVHGHLLVSHTHWDHIQGIPFFAPLFMPGNNWHIYGPRGLGTSLRETLAGQMQYTYFPVALNKLGATVEYHDLVEGTFELDGVRVTTRYLNHPALTLGYRIEADGACVVYASDHEPHAQALAAGGDVSSSEEDAHHAAFLEGADLVIHDTQYHAGEYPEKIGWGHSTIEYAVASAHAAKVERLALYHHDPLRTDDAVDGIVARAREQAQSIGFAGEVFAAAEGMHIDLLGGGEKRAAPADEPDTARDVPALDTVANTVLMAVPNVLFADVVRQAVEAEGLHLIEAENADAVLELVQREQPIVSLLAWNLPGGGALELCRRIRPGEREDGSKIIAVAAEDRPGAREQGQEAGIDGWLVWPFTVEYARTRLRAWVLRLATRWKKAPLPENEAERVRALHALNILDTPPEDRFDQLTQKASALLNVPIALISLVDYQRQWFKSRQGLDATETPRDMAFCAHAILEDDVFVVPDAISDPRFADNPLVTDDPRVRFYAGVPLTLPNGSRAGTLCVIDHRPRELNEEQLSTLRGLASEVEKELIARPVDEIESDKKTSETAKNG